MSTVAPQDSTYQALNPGNRRRSTTARVRLEDHLLTDRKREALAANALDVWRNMGLLSWAIRRTLDYCCLYDFQPRTGDRGLDRAIKQLMARDTEPEGIDVFGRMDWDDMRRVAEAQKLLAGDCFFVKQSDWTLQMIEGAFCKSPQGRLTDQDKWINGAKLKSGRVIAWSFAENDPVSEQQTYRTVRQGAVWQHCQYEGRPNQIRPQSPIVAALNEFRDLDETFDHMRAKVKLDQLFGIAFSRQPDAEAFDSDNDAEGSQDASARVVDFGQGPAVFDLDAGEDVKPIQSQNPATNTQDFLKLCMQIALKCLDLPATFLFEDITNYSGARGAWTLFERSCHARRKTQERLHRKLTRWLLLKWTLPVEFGGTGELALPGSLTAADLQFKWVPRGIAFWKPQEELDVSLRCVAAGLQSMQDVCDERGFGDYLDNVAEIQKERDELASMGFLQQWSNSAMVRLEAVQ